MRLRDIHLKDGYRSDRDGIIMDFFMPCLDSCVRYDRAVKHVSMNSLAVFASAFDRLSTHKTVSMRIVTGCTFGAQDLSSISKLFRNENLFGGRGPRYSWFQSLRNAIDDKILEMMIAVPHSDEDVFTEEMGIFTDEAGDVVVFTGTIRESFDTYHEGFECIDVFTSWADKSRVETKIRDFESLWRNDARHLEVYSFEDAIRENLVKHSVDWAIRD